MNDSTQEPDLRVEVSLKDCISRDCSGILADMETIRPFISADDINNNPQIFKKYFSKWKYKLRLGKEVYISTESSPKRLKNGEFVTIKPGDFVLLLTEESVTVNEDVMAFISMRFDYKQKGLINVSGFHVDPLFKGKLIFSAFNAGPREIVLRRGDPIFMIFFQKLSKPIVLTKENKEDEYQLGYEFIPADMVEQIRGKSATLSSNATRLDKVEFYLKVVGGIGLATFSLLFSIILREALKH